jgi:hypothetical protein
MSSKYASKLWVIGIGVSLGAIYMAFLLGLLVDSNFHPATQIEWIVLYSQVVRLIWFLAIPPLRNTRSQNLLIVFWIEVIVMPTFALGYLLTSDYQYVALARAFFPAWVASTSIVFPVIGIFRLALSVKSDADLSDVLPGACLLFVFLSAFAQLPYVSTGVGFEGLTRTIFVNTQEILRPASLPPIFTYTVGLSGILLFITLLTYAVYYRTSLATHDYVKQLLLALLAVVSVFALTLLEPLANNPILLLAPPTFVVLGVLWWVTRGS